MGSKCPPYGAALCVPIFGWGVWATRNGWVFAACVFSGLVSVGWMLSVYVFFRLPSVGNAWAASVHSYESGCLKGAAGGKEGCHFFVRFDAGCAFYAAGYVCGGGAGLAQGMGDVGGI